MQEKYGTWIYLSRYNQNVGRNADINAIQMRQQMEMRNKLSGTRAKATLVTRWQRTWLNCVRVKGFMEDRTMKGNELNDLAGKMSKIFQLPCGYLELHIVKREM